MSTATDLAFILKRPFAEQVAFFRGKLRKHVPTETWRDLWKAEHDRAFMVAGAAKADLLADLAAAVQAAIESGESIEQFRARFGDIVQKRGWQGWTGEGTQAGTNWRTRIIYRTNMATSYAAGRHAQLQDFPLWVYRHSGAENPRLQHKAWNGLTLPKDHPFWQTHYPPNGWGCGCRVFGARSASGASRVGGQPDYTEPPEGWNALDPKTGEPAGIDEGWGYAPGASVADTVRALAPKLEVLPAEIGATFGADLPEDEIDRAFHQFFDSVMANPRRTTGALCLVGVIKPRWLEKMRAANVCPATAEIMVRDRDIVHALRDAKNSPLPVSWYRNLPSHVRAPQAVLLDRTHKEGNALLLVYDAPDGGKKLVIRLDYQLRKTGKRNIIGTGTAVDVDGIRQTIGTAYELIDGTL